VSLGHDRIIGPRIFLLGVAVSFALECCPCGVDGKVAILQTNFVTGVGVPDGSYLDVGPFVAVAFVDVMSSSGQKKELFSSWSIRKRVVWNLSSCVD
jgi:hypothetical protein